MINLNVPINSTGYGIVGTNLFKKFFGLSSDISLFPIGDCSVYDGAITNDLKKAAQNSRIRFDASNPSLRLWHQFDMAQRYSNYCNAGLTFFELDSLSPIEQCQLASLDILFVASEWAANVVKSHKTLKNLQTEIIPMGVDTNIFQPKQKQNNDGVYRFFSSGKIEVRKGHDILHEIFNMAFTPQDDVELIIKWDNPFINEEEHARWEKLYLDTDMGRVGKIKFVRSKSQADIANYINNCDCGVFPTRTEGFGLGILEVIACNKPVITTNYSAITEFCNKNNATLITPDGLCKANDGRWFFGEGNWADLDKNYIKNFAMSMRQHYENNVRDNPGMIDTIKDFNWDNTTSLIHKHLLAAN